MRFRVSSMVVAVLLGVLLTGESAQAATAGEQWAFDRHGSRWVLWRDDPGRGWQAAGQQSVERPGRGKTHAWGAAAQPVASSDGRVWDFVLPARSPAPQGSRRSEVWWARSGQHVGAAQGQTLTWAADVSGVLGPAAGEPGQWHVLSQWIGTTEGEWIGPTVALTVTDGQLRVSGGNGFADRSRYWQADLAPWQDGRAYQVHLQVHFAPGSAGWISAWVDGVQVLDRWTPTTRTGQVAGTWYPGSSKLWARSGLYRGTDAQGPGYEQRVRLVDVAMN